VLSLSFRFRFRFRFGFSLKLLGLDLGEFGDIELLNLLAGPEGSAQKLEARFYRRVTFETVDFGSLRQIRKTIAINQLSHHCLERKPVQWIIRLLVGARIFCHSNRLLSNKLHSNKVLTLGKV
jgi:hypothetical protein